MLRGSRQDWRGVEDTMTVDRGGGGGLYGIWELAG